MTNRLNAIVLAGALLLGLTGLVQAQSPSVFHNLHISSGLPDGASLTSMETVDDGRTVYGTVNDCTNPTLNGIYKFDGTAWTQLGGKPNNHGIQNVAVVDDTIYVIGHDTLYSMDINTAAAGSLWTMISSPSVVGGKKLKKFITNGSRIFGLFESNNGNLRLLQYSISGGNWFGVSGSTSIELPTHGVSDMAVDKDRNVYVAFMWQFKDSWTAEAGYSKGAVYKIFRNGTVADITGGEGGYSQTSDKPLYPVVGPGALDLRDMTGIKSGPMGDIEYDWATETLYASTEHGLYSWDGRNWNLTFEHRGNRDLTYSAGSIIAMSGRYDISITTGSLTKTLPSSDPIFSCKYGKMELATISGQTLLITQNGKHLPGVVCDWRGGKVYELYQTDLSSLNLIATNSLTQTYGSYLEDTVTPAPTSALALLKNETFAFQVSNTVTSTVLVLLDLVAGTSVPLLTLPSVVNDMSISLDRTALALCGDFGIQTFDADSLSLLWEYTAVSVQRVDVAQSSAAAVGLSDKTMLVFSESGLLEHSIVQSDSYVSDVAIDTTNNIAIVTGFNNMFNYVAHEDMTNPVQVAFIKAFSLDTALYQWRTYNYDPDDLDINMADTRGYRVEIGQDGTLLYLGESAGGNTIYRWNGHDLSTTTWVLTDKYSHPYNSKSAHLAYVARINPTDGFVLFGQFYFPRLASQGDITNTNRVTDSDVTSLPDGTVFFTSRSSCCFSNRDLQEINNQPIGDYSGQDGMVISMTPDFSTRLFATTPSKVHGQSDFRSIDVLGTTLLFAGSTQRGEMIDTAQGTAAPRYIDHNVDSPQGYTGAFLV